MNNRSQKNRSYSLSRSERKRRRREGILIFVIIGVVALLTIAETRTIYFGADIPISNTILMFILININLLLLLLLIFLVFRNLVKLLYDRKRGVVGSKLRTRLVVAFVTLSLLPAVILFFFSINFITTSLKFWFNVPVEKTLEHSLFVGRSLYDHIETENIFFLERVSYQIHKKGLLPPTKRKALSRYLQIVQREFNRESVEVYDSGARRLTYSLVPILENDSFPAISSEDLLRPMPAASARTITTITDYGELVKTIGAIPFGAPVEEAKGFVVVSQLISSDLSEKMTSIARGFAEYQQIKLLKKPIQISYYISLSIVASLVAFCAIWFGFYLAKTISIPIKELADGTRRVAEGDLSVNIAPAADDEIGSLVDSFNKMTKDLRINREQLELSAKMLRQQNIEIEERRRYMEIVLRNVSAGVITLDTQGTITTINKSAEKMLQLNPAHIVTRNFKNVLKPSHYKQALEIIKKLDGSSDGKVELPLRITIGGRPRSFLIQINVLSDDPGNNVGIVMVFDDLTELEKGQRMAAWREVARRIAHEVKNPLTPISLSAQRLKRKYSKKINEPVFDECTRMIIDHVDLIRNLVNEFSAFARFPSANPEMCRLEPIVNETVALYREGLDQINFHVKTDDHLPRLNLDRRQIKQALINLVDNAISAMKGRGEISISASFNPEHKRVRLEIADSGPGISDTDKTRLFEPNFSTKKSGMGLGLTIVNTIITEHNGMIRIQDRHPNGAIFVIDLPV